MNEKNIEALGLVLKNTYFIHDYEPANSFKKFHLTFSSKYV